MGRLADSGKQSAGRSIFLTIPENGKKRVRVLFSGPIKGIDGSVTTGTKGEPFGSWWHRIAEDARVGRKYHDWLCIGKYRNCPLCFDNERFVDSKAGVDVKNGEKPWPVRKKTYVNVWDYEEGKVRVVSAGSKLWDGMTAIETARGIDIDTLDITILKSGKGMRTEYQVVAGEASPFILPDGHFLFHLEEETAVSDRPKENLDQVISGEYDKQFTNNRSSAPAGAGAPAGQSVDMTAVSGVVINFGQYAGRSLSQILAIDPRYISWLAANCNDAAIAQAAAILMANSAPPAQAPPVQQPPSNVPPINPQAPPPPPPPPPASLTPPAASPFDQLAAANSVAGSAKTIQQLRDECIAKASSNPAFRNTQVLIDKMKEAGGSTDLNAFTAQQLEKLLSIM